MYLKFGTVKSCRNWVNTTGNLVQGVKLGLWTPNEKKNKRNATSKGRRGKFKQGSDKKKHEGIRHFEGVGRLGDNIKMDLDVICWGRVRMGLIQLRRHQVEASCARQ